MAATSAAVSASRRLGRRRTGAARSALRRIAGALILTLALSPALPESADAQSGNRKLAVPQPETLLLLIRTTLVALNHANQTGNYTVLRDIAAPIFQEKFSAADLGAIFASLRARSLDLAPVVIVTPELSAAPEISPAGHLTVTGYFPTQPLRIEFNLVFVVWQGLWKLGAVSVDVPPAAAAPPQPPPAAQREPAPARQGPTPSAKRN